MEAAIDEAAPESNLRADRTNEDPSGPVPIDNKELEDMDNLPPPDVIAQEIVEDLEAALAEFAAVAESLAPVADEPTP